MSLIRGTTTAVLSIALFALLPAQERNAGPEWPGWGGPNGDFTARAERLATTWPAAGPRTLWKRPLGEGHSSIVVDGNRLFTMYRPPTGVRNRWSAEEVVVALDSASGRTIWEHRFPSSLETMDFSQGAGPHSTPLVAGDRLFAAATDKQFFALDKHTGKVLWHRSFVRDFNAPPNQMRYAIKPGYAPSPVAWRDMVIAMVGGPNQGVMAFRQSDGNVVWRGGNFPDDISPASPFLINLDGQDQLVVTSGDGVHGMDPATGRMLWSFAFPTRSGVNITTPIWSPAERQLFLTAAYDGGSRLLQLRRNGDRTQVEQLWYTNRMRVHFSNVVRFGNFFYGSNGDFGPAFLSAVNGTTGDIVWRDRTFAKAHLLKVGDGRVVLLDENGTLALASLTQQGVDVLASAEVSTSPSWTVPTLVGSTLYVRDRREIMAVDLADQ